MRILLLGAGGFIGRTIRAELLRRGHDVVAVVRRPDGSGDRRVAINLAEATDPASWHPHLAGVDVVINAAGVLRGPEMETVHVDAPRALYSACADAGVKRVVLISAISARSEVDTDYSRTKLRGEAELMRSGLDWTILRPSLVYGDGSYGGTSLIRGMAGLPWFIPVPGDGSFAFSPIHADDLARAVRLICEDNGFSGQTLEPAGPQTLSLRDLLVRYRRWLGFGTPRILTIPMAAMRLFGRLGDLFGAGPIATNSVRQMIAGNGGDGAAFAAAIGFTPRSINEALRDRPSHVQDRWHARLFFLAPLATAVLLAMWIASAVLGLAFGDAETRAVVQGLGLPETCVRPLQLGGSLLDLSVAALLAADRTARWSTAVQLVVVLGYTVVIGLAQPHLWFDPLGPLLKNLPIIVLILMRGAVAVQR
ncbi:NAD(P)H-binding protein [Sphingomonas sp. MAH-20]|uniref:NAD(P)H-binding protein n=1 Tax=Sphingomonas horti TaxID=2682842 RepID=A0A6I4J026_9SPHN|nr:MULTISPECIES: NAD(P)H-binding protein [Sphingomonas]MBA2920009.1 NAD(P)H-binding protein [Sphingomonas sp. CGMCC 1.13658]MVO77890.1 NAD(P)H-binding protein [Sphingomonas horti]